MSEIISMGAIPYNEIFTMVFTCRSCDVRFKLDKGDKFWQDPREWRDQSKSWVHTICPRCRGECWEKYLPRLTTPATDE